jgi:hypothetical protein
VLDAIGTRGYRTAGMVRQRAGTDVRVSAVVDRLVASGQLASQWRRSGHRLTAAGRRSLRQLRAEPPVRGVAAGTSAAAVAVGGPAAMPDAELRAALFESDRPVRTRRRGLVVGRGWAGTSGVAGSAALYSSPLHQYGYGCGAHGGGHSCGGGGGGGGCGGGCGGGG